MSPSDLTSSLERLTERMHTALVAAAALVTLTVLSAIAQQLFGAFSFGMAGALIGLGALGAAVALGLARVTSWQREDLYDSILIARYRHVGGTGVQRYRETLTSIARRREYARSLERFLETATGGLPSAVPVNRPAVREHAERLQAIANDLRCEKLNVTPEGMVLLRRLIVNGAESPVYHAVGEPRDLGRALDRIEDWLVVHTDERALALAA
jgi:hypothetical protein